MEISADDLWAVEPGTFVAERDALAKRLRAEGDREGAAAVKTRKRPPVSAWALNAVARSEPDLITAALDAGAALEAALQGTATGDGSSRPEAQRAERQASEALIGAAADRIAGTGQQVTDAFKARMMQSIRAAQLDEAVAARLRAGTLADDETPNVFGFAPSPDSPAAPSKPQPKPATRSKKPAAVSKPPRGKAPADKAVPVPAGEPAGDAPTEAPAEVPAKPVRKAVDKAAEKAAREVARAARVALAHQQDEARRLIKRADRLEERAREMTAAAQAANDEAVDARDAAERAAAALAEAGHPLDEED